jgi:O-antigen/teichoic acid export membrane protein
MNKYLAAASANFIFFVINTIFFLAIIPISLKVMGDEFFGLWSILYAIVLLSNVGTLGIGSIVNKFASEAQTGRDAADYFSQVFTAGLMIVLPMAALIAAGLLLGRNLIAAGLTRDAVQAQQFSSALALVAASLLPQFLARVPQGFLLSQLQNRTARLIETFSVVSLWLGAVLLVLLVDKNLRLIGGWCLINSAISLGLYFWAARKSAGLHFDLNLRIVRKMLNFSSFMLIESTAIALFQHLDKLIVGLTLGPALAGVYAVGTSVGLRMSMLVGPVTEVLIPYASLRDSLQEYDRLRVVFRRVSRYLSLIVAGIGGLAVVWMADFLSVWISPDYAAQYSQAFQLLILAYALLSLCRPGHQSLTGMGKVRFTSLVYAAATALMLITLYFLSNRLGLIGAVLANFGMAGLLVYNLYMYRLSGTKKTFQTLLSDLSCGLCVPGLSFIVVSVFPGVVAKLVVTAVIGVLLAVVFFRDDWVRDWRAGAQAGLKKNLIEMTTRFGLGKTGKHQS